jgi:hypothetical protein
MYTFTHLTAAERADVHARARSQAQDLRRAAVGDFWHGVYRMVVGSSTPSRKHSGV